MKYVHETSMRKKIRNKGMCDFCVKGLIILEQIEKYRKVGNFEMLAFVESQTQHLQEMQSTVC